MKTFTDSLGQPWTVTIHVTALKRVRDLVGVDLFKLADEGFAALANLVSDPVKLCDVLFALCKEEAEARGVTDDAFGRAMFGDALEQAANAFLEALVDFFPSARTRAGLMQVIEKSRSVQAKVLDHAERQLAQIDLDREAEQLIQAWASKPSSTTSPELSASIPAD